jgi:hypothetical protein
MIAFFLGIAKLLGSAGFGTIFGGVMGYFNRKADLALKRLEMEDRDKQRIHELAQRDKDAAIMEKEWVGREKVALVEGAAKVEVEQYAAIAKSYDFAKPAAGSKMEAFSSFVRPFMSLCYFIVTSLGSAWIIYYAFTVKNIVLTPEQWHELVMYVISWIAFMAGSTIGWWYAMRPGGKMPFFERRP